MKYLYVLRTLIDLMKENGFTLKKKKAKSRRYHAETITDGNYTDELSINLSIYLVNFPIKHHGKINCEIGNMVLISIKIN